jgi:hypothetical protein
MDCTEDHQLGDSECDFVYHGDDYFSNEGPTYFDADFIRNDFGFNGWVNKTGATVTIEGLYYPERNSYVTEGTSWHDFDGDGEEEEYPFLNAYMLGRWVTDYCNGGSQCEIIFYGHGGLTYNGKFSLSISESQNDYIDTDGDGVADLEKYWYFYEHFTVTFDLPFDPYGFSLIYQNQYQIDRIF